MLTVDLNDYRRLPASTVITFPIRSRASDPPHCEQIDIIEDNTPEPQKFFTATVKHHPSFSLQDIKILDPSTVRVAISDCEPNVHILLSAVMIIILSILAISPTIDSPPMDFEGSLNSSVTLTCNATAQPPPKYTWFFVSGESTNKTIQGENTAVYVINSLKPKDRGRYFCSVENPLNVVTSSEAIVSINGKRIVKE